MTKCPACSSAIPDEMLSCPSCGAALNNSSTPTRAGSVAPPPVLPQGHLADHKPSPSAAHLSPGSTGEARFVPGAILAGRYRIIGLLGKGGMGEVYRADDLKLDQPMALKFLPAALAADGAALARFHGEVRIARQITHPNVCRVHDIGEVATDFGSLHYLSMEYIDGEDLSTLLRRIGRLPTDKGVEIARQLCAGLAAAHEIGVLHRDLKPANVMIDGRGKVRITDFGLAGLAEEFGGDEVRAGTPAYMAPEQLTGKEVTIKSDLYALGLVLYELFTGKRVFEARTIDELIRLHEHSTPTTPSSHIKEIDPLVERVIMRCLEKDPSKRPASALQVAAALPGGDPIQAALAAGETPSPEMVAAAPREGSLRPAAAVICLAAVLIGLVLLVFLPERFGVYRRVAMERSPEVLADRAGSIARRLGYTEPPIDTAFGFRFSEVYYRYLDDRDKSPTRWDQLAKGQPALLQFWYRQSPRYLEPATGYSVSLGDPPPLIPGMASVWLDTRGRLLEFRAVPPQLDPTPGAPPAAPDWAACFGEAGLDLSKFKPVEPQWFPFAYSDQRAAWEGVFPDQPQIPLRVEAASLRGQTVYFALLGPWNRPAQGSARVLPWQIQFLHIFAFSVFVLLLIAGVRLARRNWRLGRGDHKGATRLALAIFAAELLRWLFRASHVPTLAGEIWLFGSAAGWALIQAAVLWLGYLALEPYARRRWPERIISWSRLLVGAWRDPMVGRDLLIGTMLGIWIITAVQLAALLEQWLGWRPDLHMPDLGIWLGWHGSIAALIDSGLIAVPMMFGVFMILLLMALLLRRDSLAVGVAWLFYVVAIGLQIGPSPIMLVTVLLATAALLFVMMRFGLLAAVAVQFFIIVADNFPFTTNFSAWYAGSAIFALLVMVVTAGYGFYTSLAGQSVFQGKLLDD